MHARAALLTALLRVTTHLTPEAPAFYLIDAKPLPLCHPVRHRRVRLLREDGARFGKTSQGWFFGFQLHVLRHTEGRMVNLVLTPGHGDDREPALGLALGAQGGITLGDLGYRGARRAAELAEEADRFLRTRAEAPTHQRLLTPVREAVETTFSQLWYKFLDRILARSWHGLWHTVQLQAIHYNLRQAGCLPVQ